MSAENINVSDINVINERYCRLLRTGRKTHYFNLKKLYIDDKAASFIKLGKLEFFVNDLESVR